MIVDMTVIKGKSMRCRCLTSDIDTGTFDMTTVTAIDHPRSGGDSHSSRDGLTAAKAPRVFECDKE
jgi:hypothetical protein